MQLVTLVRRREKICVHYCLVTTHTKPFLAAAPLGHAFIFFNYLRCNTRNTPDLSLAFLHPLTSASCSLKSGTKFSLAPIFYQKHWAKTWKVVGGKRGGTGAAAGSTGRPCPSWCPSTDATAKTKSTLAAIHTRALASICLSSTTRTACGARKRSTTGFTTPDDTSSADATASVLTRLSSDCILICPCKNNFLMKQKNCFRCCIGP